MTRPAAAMVNLLGDLWSAQTPDWQPVLELPDVALHLYGKSAPRGTQDGPPHHMGAQPAGR